MTEIKLVVICHTNFNMVLASHAKMQNITYIEDVAAFAMKDFT